MDGQMEAIHVTLHLKSVLKPVYPYVQTHLLWTYFSFLFLIVVGLLVPNFFFFFVELDIIYHEPELDFSRDFNTL